jgi:hypothetical protein
MTSDNQVDVQSILAGAQRAGMPLTADEAAELVKGIGRNKDMARTVRSLLESTTEPAGVFSAATRRRS